MTIALPLAILAETLPDQIAVEDDSHVLTYGALDRLSDALAARIIACGVDCVAMLAPNTVLFPALLFGAAKAGVPFVPLNYRLTDAQLTQQGARLGRALLVHHPAMAGRMTDIAGLESLSTTDLFFRCADSGAAAVPALPDPDDDAAACWLFTSGTTGTPKAAVLSHANLTAYLYSTVEPLSAAAGDAMLASVPPYHIAGLAGVLSNVFAGRRIVYLDQFTPQGWVERARAARVTQAMVVPTMLGRILTVLDETGQSLPDLRSLSYGGGRMPADLIVRAMRTLPHVDFTNAYGLTETSSTLCVLNPDDHRQALSSPDPAIRARLGSVGRALPGVNIEIRKPDGTAAAMGEKGEIWVRGPQIAGRYRDQGSLLIDGWFPTRDEGWMDSGGYLFLAGRADDVIVRGGENISPGEIEDVILGMPGVTDVAVVARPDPEWGEVPVAFVVIATGTPPRATPVEHPGVAEIQSHVRQHLRSTRVPASVFFLEALPYNETGKLMRAALRARLSAPV